MPATVTAIPYVTRRLDKEDQPVAEEDRVESQAAKATTAAVEERERETMVENQKKIAAWLDSQRDSD